MAKLDFKTEYRHFYKPSARRIEAVDVPVFPFLMIDGTDARPGTPAFDGAIGALFALSYRLKFMSKNNLGRDYAVMPLEGLWWADDMDDFLIGAKERWRWTLMIHQPPWLDEQILGSAGTEAAKKNPHLADSVEKVRLEPFAEGMAMQTLYIGPFADEGPVIADIHEEIRRAGGELDGKHHEIYLSDFRRTAPEKLKTVIRQPFRPS
jgi:hypothetical protein